jgi:DNA polymerase I-like protein with 3'-5' exonuclease and polymerase domains
VPTPQPKFNSTQAWAEHLVEMLSRGAEGLPEEDLAALKSQLSALTAAPAVTPPADDKQTAVVRRRQDLERLAQALRAAPVVAVDLATSRTDPRAGEVVGVGLACAGEAYYVPSAHRLEGARELLPDQTPPADLAQALGLDRLPLLAHDAKRALRWLRHCAGVNLCFAWDTMLAARLLRSDLPAGLQETACRELDVPDWGLSARELARVQFLPIDRVAAHCGKNARYTLELYQRQQACLDSAGS